MENRMNKKRYIYVVRHCEATGQESECELTEKGQLQANTLVTFFEDIKIDKIISSPFTRAIKSIQPLANQLLLKINIDENLSERILSSANLPEWLDCLEQTFNDFSLTYSGGESNNEAMDRAKKVLEEVFNEDNKIVMLVTHGNLMTLILKYFDEQYGFEEWKHLTNPDVFKVTLGIKPKVERVWQDSNKII
jgi:2,3-bisphosphoglycerate-dependent phosphoglycerate mutase